MSGSMTSGIRLGFRLMWGCYNGIGPTGSKSSRASVIITHSEEVLFHAELVEATCHRKISDGHQDKCDLFRITAFKPHITTTEICRQP
jgi:hypothetical protein